MTQVYHLQESQIVIPATNNIRKVYVELSSECNFDCEMCFRQSFSGEVGTMTTELLERVQREIETLPELREVVLGGLGEPLLHPQIQEFVAFLKQRGLAVTITTNGALLAPFIEGFIAQGLDTLMLSFETGDIGHANENDLLRTIAKIRECKEGLQQGKPAIVLFMVATSENIRDLARIGKLLRGSGVSEVVLSNLLPATEVHRPLVLYPRPVPKEITAFKATLDLNILLDRIRCSLPQFEILTERSCDFIERRALVIRWDGAVAPCYRHLHSRKEIVLDKTKVLTAATFGNVRTQSLIDIWNDREYTWYRFTVHNNFFPSCLDCTLRDGCDFIESTVADCWGNPYSCADCLWARGIVKCP